MHEMCVRTPMDQILLLGPKNYSNSNRWHTTWLDGSVGINCKIKDIEIQLGTHGHIATLGAILFSFRLTLKMLHDHAFPFCVCVMSHDLYLLSMSYGVLLFMVPGLRHSSSGPDY